MYTRNTRINFVIGLGTVPTISILNPKKLYKNTASATEEAPSSMVSSEAESEGSILSEARHDTSEHYGAQSDLTIDHGGLDRNLAQNSGDWRNVSSAGTSYVSTRGKIW